MSKRSNETEIKRLAERYGVSKQAMIVRLTTLFLIGKLIARFSEHLRVSPARQPQAEGQTTAQQVASFFS